MHFNLTCDITKLWLYQRVKSTHPRTIGFKNTQSHKIYHFWDIRDIIKVSVKHPLSISNPAFLESLPHPASHMGHTFFLSFYLPSVLLILANFHLPWEKVGLHWFTTPESILISAAVVLATTVYTNKTLDKRSRVLLAFLLCIVKGNSYHLDLDISRINWKVQINSWTLKYLKI